ncbi:MAG: hypoxanthine phosphoribosyltransferase [Clostridia bacterium]|nr:hypoxanthine phosphoribosyltransferase [Clostridia bacterium]
MLNDAQRILISEEELHNIVSRLGAKITEDYKDKNLLLVSVLKGAVVFMTDLMREVKIPCGIDFMATSSYDGAKSTGVVRIVKDLDIDIEGMDVLIVEDILDSGRTLSYITSILLKRNPASLKICTLLDKPSARVVNTVKPDYVGAEVEDEFVIGYGLDYNEKYRNLPCIAILKKEIYINNGNKE